MPSSQPVPQFGSKLHVLLYCWAVSAIPASWRFQTQTGLAGVPRGGCHHNQSHQLDFQTYGMHRRGAIQVSTDIPSLPLKSKFVYSFTRLDNTLFLLEFKSKLKNKNKPKPVTAEFRDAQKYPRLPHYQCITSSQYLAHTNLSHIIICTYITCFQSWIIFSYLLKI